MVRSHYRRGLRSRFFGLGSVRRAVPKILILLVVFQAGVIYGGGPLPFYNTNPFEKSAQNGLPEDLDYQEIESLYDSLRASFDGELDVKALSDGLKSGLVRAAGDPYTEYLNEQSAKEFNEDLNGSFEGIGAELSKEDNYVVIVSPLDGFPAQKAGIRPKDIIVEIDGQNAYDISVSDAVKKIRGTKGTSVNLKIVRDADVLSFDIVRETISIPSIKDEILEGNIGYMKISRFGEDTTSLAKEVARKFKEASVDSIILDLRGNPGGLLDASVDVSSLWLKDKIILQEKRGNKVVQTFRSRGTAVLEGVPTVVLIDEGSASASEIIAGALRDHNSAYIIGVKSFGKGSVQELRNLRGGGLLKVTIARWYTPNGRNIDKEGIEPDKKVELSEDNIKNNQDLQKESALQYLQTR